MWLRLFPLQAVVLFPGVELPLVVFEERYRQLTRECMDAGEPFGVLLLREGQEAGDSGAVPCDVGTTARITSFRQTPDDQLRLIVTGERRFRVESYDHSHLYLSAEARFLDDSPDEAAADPSLVDDVRDMGSRLIQGLAARRGGWMRAARLPDDPTALSFFLADFLSGDKGEQQRLLEAATEERLEQERSLLRDILDYMKRRPPSRSWKPGFGKN